jgi:L-amino acid N-acyltransferase YncA
MGSAAAPRIRLAREADAASMAAIYAPVVEATAISFETVAPNANEMARRLAAAPASYPWLVCQIGGEVAGYAYASRHRERAAYRWSVDTSVYVAPRLHRQGVGRGLYTSLFAILAAQGHVSAFAGITLPNPASVALHEAMGFTRLGVYHRVGYKHGAWHDVGWWEVALRAHDERPAEPVTLATLRGRPEWNALLTRGEPMVRTG